MTDGPVLVPVLDDQSTPDIASLRGMDKARSVVLMMEVACWDRSPIRRATPISPHVRLLLEVPNDVKKRVGDDACPFNALYWDFLARNERKLARNPHMAMLYCNWNRMRRKTHRRLEAGSAVPERG